MEIDKIIERIEDNQMIINELIEIFKNIPIDDQGNDCKLYY